MVDTITHSITQAGQSDRTDTVKKTLTPAEYAIYTYIADRTLRFNKSWECITAKDIVEGKWDGEGRWIHCGVKMTERNVYRVLSTLTEKGYILKKPWRTYGNFYQYAINLESELFHGYENSITMMAASLPVVEDPELENDETDYLSVADPDLQP